MKVLLVFAFIVAIAVPGFAQTKVTDELSLDAGVAKHAGIDEIYRKFSKAYRDLDHKVFSELYTESAAYLVPGDDIQVGGGDIVKGFERFFDSVRGKNERMTISFQIVQRKVAGSMGYDVGIYTLSNFKGNAKLGTGRGKFVVVAVRDGARWQFQVDGYSDMPKR